MPNTRNTNALRTLLVDGDAYSRRLLRVVLSSFPETEIVGEARTASAAAQMLESLGPDLVFIDAALPDGNGLEVFRNARERPCLILTTSDSGFALSAIELEAVDYLVKPLQRTCIARSLARAKQRIVLRNVAGLAAKIAEEASSFDRLGHTKNGAEPRYPERMVIRVRRRLVSLEVREIDWIQGASQYCRLHTRQGEFLLSRPLGSIECELDPDRFFRIHRSAIVNSASVSEIRSGGDGRYDVHLRGGEELPLGRARRSVLEKLLTGLRQPAQVA
jgi:two-component system LytT family response regulator